MQTNVQTDGVAKDTGVMKLEECLRGELSAVETYELALKSVTHVGLHRALQELLASHSRRVELLRERLGRLGADATQGSGVWGAFAKTVQAGADLLGDRTAIMALEEGEDQGLSMYKDDMSSCDAKTKSFIETQLLPDQQRSHDLCKTLKDYMKHPS